ncbi:MAG: lytic transglycosylase domain-containing protein [Bacteroidetes bacterium]|nr:MAG: lytic transglycosylase domain-containing protein [Bacteroidota bacterium]
MIVLQTRKIVGCFFQISSLFLAFLCAVSFTANAQNANDSLIAKQIPSSFATEAPLVGETIYLNPLAENFVASFIQKNGSYYTKIYDDNLPVIAMYNSVLQQYGLPTTLKYVSFIESGLQRNLVSRAGAKGPWQLMGDEAKRFGLRKGGKDLRTDYVLSTHAASKLLLELYDEFNDWLLVVAAYNCGVGRMKQAIRRAGSASFWELDRYLPKETQNHVRKYIATVVLLEGKPDVTTLTANEIKQYQWLASVKHSNKPPVLPKQVLASTSIYGNYSAEVVAAILDMPVQTVHELNPNMNSELLAERKYLLRLPKHKMQVFQAKRKAIFAESERVFLAAEKSKAAGETL